MQKSLFRGLLPVLAALLLLSVPVTALAAELVEAVPVEPTQVPVQVLTPEPAAPAGAPVITADLSDFLYIPAGAPFTLTVGATGQDLQYQWYFNGSPIPGAVGYSYSVAGADAARSGSYFCYIRNAGGAVQSRSCNVVVLVPPVLVSDINISSLTLSIGDFITLSASASGTNVQAQWYYVLNTTDIRPLNGQTDGTLSIPAAAEYNGADFYCQFLNEAGAVTTSFCHITVNGLSRVPTITKNPTGETVAAGERALFIARADNTRSYLWRFINQSGISYDYTGIGGMFPGLGVSGGDTDTLTLSNIPEELNGWAVACLFKGDGDGEILSEKAYITVKSKSAAVTITQQPSAATMSINENPDFTLSVTAASSDGSALTYQWYSAPDSSAVSMIPIAGAVNSSYKPSPRKEGTTYYRVAVMVSQNGAASQPYFSSTVPVTFIAEEVHTHVYGDAWEYNDLSHWHQCSCGAHSAEAMHTYEWTMIIRPTSDRDGQQKGKCTVCGYETIQPIPAGSMPEEATAAPVQQTTAPRKSSRIGLLAVLCLAALGVLGAAAWLAVRLLRQDDDDQEDEYELPARKSVKKSHKNTSNHGSTRRRDGR